ncbi:MAG: APC family permease [Holosporaceae bacterium]|jgi:amino acid transporter|nr:APC family permease [Holosporaceae bacterium]
MSLIRFIFGNPLKSENIVSVRFSKTKALAVFSSDVLSSISYATEEILLVLGLALAHSFALPVAATIVGLIFVVSVSYWQTVEAYPSGGGAFTVVHENLGEFFGLIAAAALLIDYTLTVAVSLSVGARAVASIFPDFSGYSVSFCITALLLIAFVNLRGAKEFSMFFVVPTYCFVGLAFLMIIVGLFKSSPPIVVVAAAPLANDAARLSGLVVAMALIKAFAYGSSVLTGIEAIASGVTAFRKPQYKNAQATLVVMSCVLALLFLGLTFVSHRHGVAFSANETVISQMARRLFGSGILYHIIQFATICILLIAANSAFSGFPRLASVLAKKKYIPTSFANLGDRLAYSNGIVMLAVVSSLLIVKFKADPFALIALYSIGVFISFTLSQSGMVVHWLRVRGENWHIKAAINAVGSMATMATLLVVVESNFSSGAWIILLMIPALFFVFRKINDRYNVVNVELDLKKGGLGKLLRPLEEAKPKVVVPVSRIHKGTLAALRFASSLSKDVVAVTVNVDQQEVDRLKLTWRSMNFQIPLVILKSPYRSIINPFLDFLEEQDERQQELGKAIVVMPSFVPGKMWQNILHNQTATILKTALLYRKRKSEQTRVIVEIPYQMRF